MHKISNRNLNIDSLRAVAALSVLTSHVLHLKAGIFGQISSIGVLLFFLISGYCIVLSLSTLGTRPILSFLIRRFFRLYPVYWIAVVFGTVMSTENISVHQFLGNLTMIQTALRIQDIVGVFWTLFIEIIFYGFIVLFLLFGLTERANIYMKSLILLMVITLCASIIRKITGIAIPFGYFLFLSVFLMGGLICKAHQEKQTINKIIVFYLATVFIITYLIFGNETFLSGNIHTVSNYIWALVIFSIVMNRKWLAWKWLAYVGKISFCIYLFHVPIYNVLVFWIHNKPAQLVITLSFTLIMSMIINKIIEDPFIKMSRRIQQVLKPSLTSKAVSLGNYS